MNLALRKPMTLPEFLEWESGQEFRYGFDGFHPVAMTGGTRAHATIQCNFAVSLADSLRGKSGNFLGIDLKIEAAGRIRYGSVLAGKVRCQNSSPKLFANVTYKAGIDANPPQTAGGRIANFDLPRHFDDIILGHEIQFLR